MHSWPKAQARLGGRIVTNTANPHLGSTLDDLLDADGTLAEAEAVAVKRVIAWQIDQAMAAEHLGKAELGMDFDPIPGG